MMIKQVEPEYSYEQKEPESLRNGSQYLYDLGPCPGESENELEETEVFYLGNEEGSNPNEWDNYSEQNYWSEGEWDPNGAGDYWSESSGSQSENQEIPAGRILLEEIREDLTSMI